ncbi:EamA family transporter [Taibaiella sp. KBW10]|uniref:EamA family transporter n=1 Tax=Taibaiella sp. KBW10 TaxID=2153357 RepID=UPI0013151964|nr:EamA family transporter [Taibaiella sp. KBW10]
MSIQSKAWISLIFICIAWGTTYLGIKMGLEALPPFLMAGFRQASAGIIIGLIAFSNKKANDWSWGNIRRQALIGFLLITLGNGLVSWAEAYIPSGVAALVCATMPLVSVLINVMIHKSEKINTLIVVGMFLGFAGVALNFKDSFNDLSNTSYLMGIGATLIATTSWAYGSIMGKKNKSTGNPVFNSALQVFSGGVFLLLFSPLVDDYHKINLQNTQALLAIVYLIIVGSVLAYTAYMYALKHLPVGIVMVYAYINPLVAVLLGWQLANEPLNIYTLLSFISIALGVYLVNRGYRKQ